MTRLTENLFKIGQEGDLDSNQNYPEKFSRLEPFRELEEYPASKR